MNFLFKPEVSSNNTMPTTKPQKIIIIDDAIPFAKEMFTHLGEVQLIAGKAIDAELAKTADALIIRSRTQIDQTLLKQSNASFVGSTVVGLDHIDQDYLASRDIHFYSAQGCNANSVAEYVITCLLIMAEKFQFTLANKTLGIIGVGNVGSLVHKKANALGMTCLLNDPPKILLQPELAESYTDLENCLSADILTFHTPLTTGGKFATLDLLGKGKLKQIKPNQILINAARGGIINEAAWSQTQTLCNIIDCWENEPNISEALYKQANIATPHIAGHSLDAKIAGTEMVYHELCKHWDIEPQTSWKSALPSKPNTITLENEPASDKIQTILKQVTQQTHNPLDDDRAIRSNDIDLLRSKYEDYRRNFPIYREWKEHEVSVTKDNEICKVLNLMGFNLI